MPTPTLTVLGQNLTNSVTQWGAIEQVKDVLLARAELMTSEIEIELDNLNGAFSARGAGTLFGGSDWRGKPLTVAVDGRTEFDGILRNVRPNETGRRTVLMAENRMKKPSESILVASGTSVNPASAALGWLRTVIDEDNLDAPSFYSAGGPARLAGATITYVFGSGDGVTILGALTKVSQLCSIAFFTVGSRIRAQAFRPYQGSGSDLRFPLTDTVVREWGEMTQDDLSFNNRVTVGYPGPAYATQNDLESQRVNDVIREMPFSADDKLTAADQTSAEYFGRLYLDRAGYRRDVLALVAGPELVDVRIGQRFPVTRARLGLAQTAMEVYLVRPRLDSNEYELGLTGLAS
jgi:hypothetical protein